MLAHHPAPRARNHPIGTLCCGGDWACANGDLEALADIARRLVDHARAALRPRLAEVSSLVRSDPDQAIAAWAAVRAALATAS